MILKMQQKQRLFIYSRKEMIVLVLLGSLVAVFAFTLGVHLGKKVGPEMGSPHLSASQPLESAIEELPSPQQLADEAEAIREASDESLDHAAHSEVERTGLRLESPRQVELPRVPKTAVAGATTIAPENRDSRAPVVPVEPGVPEVNEGLQAIPGALRPAPAGRYTLQIGSFRTVQEAGERAEVLEAAGLKPFLREADVKGKGKWFRVYVGGYESKDEAEKAGVEFRNIGVISSFIVANAVQ